MVGSYSLDSIDVINGKLVYYVTHGPDGPGSKLKKKKLTLTEEVTTSVHTTTRDGVDMRM